MKKENVTAVREEGCNNGRMQNLDMLRCLAMMLVVVLHYLGKGDILSELTDTHMSLTEGAAWFLEALAIVAVNVYMLLSGYFVSTGRFKLSRLLKLWLQLEFYSLVVGGLAIVTNLVPGDDINTYFLLGLIFPVSMGHYWFMTAYIYLYILLALISPILDKLEKKQWHVILGLLFTGFSLVKSVVPVRFELDELGYDCLWYLCMFLLGAYIRRYGLPVLTGKLRGALAYVGGAALIFAGTMLMRRVYLATGSLSYILKFLYDYNHILNVIAALGLFAWFLHMQVPGGLGALAGKLAPYTLGVYLLHENQAIRYLWPKWLGADAVNTVNGLLASALIACVIVFALGIAVDKLRTVIMAGLHKVLLKWSLYSRLCVAVYDCDRLMSGNDKE